MDFPHHTSYIYISYIIYHILYIIYIYIICYFTRPWFFFFGGVPFVSGSFQAPRDAHVLEETHGRLVAVPGE